METSERIWMSTAEAAEQLGITTRTVYRLIDDGLLTGYRFGRVIRLKSPEIEAFVENSRIHPGGLTHSPHHASPRVRCGHNLTSIADLVAWDELTRAATSPLDRPEILELWDG